MTKKHTSCQYGEDGDLSQGVTSYGENAKAEAEKDSNEYISDGQGMAFEVEGGVENCPNNVSHLEVIERRRTR